MASSTFRYHALIDGQRYQSHEYIVYVQGRNVTPWVSGVSGALNTDMGGAEITFKNPMDALTLTYENAVLNQWRLSTDQENPQYSEAIKREIYEAKKAMNAGVVDTGSEDAESAGFVRWPLYPPCPIFQKMDTVRIFVALPWLPPQAEARWLPIFNGYIGSVSSNRSFSTNTDPTITVTCNTLKSLLHKCRIANNPLMNQSAMERQTGETIVTSKAMAGFMRDAVGTEFTSILYRKTPEQVIRYLLMGGYTDTENNASNIFSGVGDIGKGENGTSRFYNPKASEIYDSANDRYTLQAWHDGCLFGANWDGTNRSTPLALEEVHLFGLNSFSDGPSCAHGSNIAVRFLSPPDGFGFASLEAHSQGVDKQSANLVSRLDLIESVCGPINYKFWVAGTGDLIFELPMNDFDLEDFGPEYSQAYKITSFDSETYNENDVDIPTVISVSGGSPTSNTDSQTGTSGEMLGKLNLAFPALAFRFGVIHENISFPYTYNADALLLYAVAYVQKKMAELEGYTFNNIGYLLSMTPNRPCLIHRHRIMASVSSVTWSIESSGQAMTFSADVDFIRKPDAEGVYRTYFGSKRAPGSYRKLFVQGSAEFSGNVTRNIDGAEVLGAQSGGIYSGNTSSGVTRGDGSSGSGSTSAPDTSPSSSATGAVDSSAQAAAGVSDANARRLAQVQLTENQKADIKAAANGDPDKEAFLTNVLTIENRGNTNVRNAVSSAGAAGPYQIMPETGRGLGLQVDGSVDERNDFGKSSVAAGKLYDELHSTYGGNKDAMYAAYNGGTKAGKAVAAGRPAPAQETRDYVAMAKYLEQKDNPNSGTPSSEDRTAAVPAPAAANPTPATYGGQVGQFAKDNPSVMTILSTTQAEGAIDDIPTRSIMPDPNPKFSEDKGRKGLAEVQPQIRGILSEA